MTTLRIDLDLSVEFLDQALTRARALNEHLSAARAIAQELVELGGPVPAVVAPPPAPAPAPAATNGTGPKSGYAKRYSAETKAAIAARAHEVGPAQAAEEAGCSWSNARAWMEAHPHTHAAGPIEGSPPRVGESHDEWEARIRDAAGSSL